MASISLRQIAKHWGRAAPVLHDINLEIASGELMVLVGPSGCGKSTLLRMLAGLETITSGELYIDGKLANTLPAAKRELAMVFQSYALYPHMNVFDNLGFALKMAGCGKEEIRQRVMQTAQTLQIEALLNRKPGQLSGGQRQRVAIGRAIVRQPKVFLFDEPLSNLDAGLRLQMRLEIARLHQQLRSTMVYVTHDQVEAMTLGQRIVVMRAGQIAQVGTPQELYCRPANQFVAGFLGTPAMNFLPAALLHHCLPQARHAHTLGIRAEHLELHIHPQEQGIPATVQHLEYLGDALQVYLYSEQRHASETSNALAPLCCRLNPHAANIPAPGQVVWLRLPAAHCHWFAQDGQVLYPDQGGHA